MKSAAADSFPSNDKSASRYLGTFDVLAPTLMLAAPVALTRYLAALFFKIPFFSLGLASALIVSANFPDTGIALSDVSSTETAAAMKTAVDAFLFTPADLSELALTLGINGLQLVFLGRVFLVALLNERNKILADKILEQCVDAKKGSKVQQKGLFGWGKPKSVESEGKEKVVVAVLGMAHCNGVKKLLTE